MTKKNAIKPTKKTKAKKAEVVRKRVLLVEDEGHIIDNLFRLLDSYADTIELTAKVNAGEALEWLREKGPGHLDVLLLDLMMPYGTAREVLDPDRTDEDEIDTGLRILEWLRNSEMEAKRGPIWVGIITARSPFNIATSAEGLLAGNGKVYYKPFDTFQLEDDLMRALEVPSKVPPGLLLGSVSDENDYKD